MSLPRTRLAIRPRQGCWAGDPQIPGELKNPAVRRNSPTDRSWIRRFGLQNFRIIADSRNGNRYSLIVTTRTRTASESYRSQKKPANAEQQRWPVNADRAISQPTSTKSDWTMKQTRTRDDLIQTLDHISRIETKVSCHTGAGRLFSFPDQHKIYEGLFLSAWTHWEEFIQTLLICDLASATQGFVRKGVREFRTKIMPYRLAERVLMHPDHPRKFVEWDYGSVKARADYFLPQGHRFTNPIPRLSDLEILRRIRNAVAHKNERARVSFLDLVLHPPFNLTPDQRRGITVGRFLAAHKWNGNLVLVESLQCLRQSALHLVP